MITSRDIAQTLLFADRKGDLEAKTLVSNTLAYLKKNNLIHLLPEVLRILEQELEKETEKESVVIETPFKVSEGVLKEISDKVLAPDQTKSDIGSSQMATTSKAGSPKQITNEGLIGGFVARHGGVIYDASLKRKLEILRKKLTK